MQKDICEQKIDSILEKLEAQGEDLKAQKLLEESHAREMFGKLDNVKDLISGGGHVGTGLSPRLAALEIRTATVERTAEKVAERFDKYTEERSVNEKHMVWGILTAIGSGILAMVFQGITWLIGRAWPNG